MTAPAILSIKSEDLYYFMSFVVQIDLSNISWIDDVTVNVIMDVFRTPGRRYKDFIKIFSESLECPI